MKNPGTLVVSPLAPYDSADPYPTHDEKYGLGGYRTVATVAERDAIPAERRKGGMLVHVQALSVIQILGVDLNSWSNAFDVTDADALRADLESIEAGKGASMIGIEDVDAHFTATDVEGALKELAEAGGGGGAVILGPAQVELLQSGSPGSFTLSHASLVGADFAHLAIGFSLSLLSANEGARGAATVGFFPDDTFNITQRIDLVNMEWTALNNTPTLIPLQDNLVWFHVLAPVFGGEIFVTTTFAQNGITGSNPFFYIGRGVPAPS